MSDHGDCQFEQAIEMARASLPRELEKKIEFLCYDFNHVNDKYDVILVSSLYQFLNPEERTRLRDTIKRCLRAEGMLFLSTFSVRDPQHYGRGVAVENDPNSFRDNRYLHLSTGLSWI
jgi:cyclopropane fatty-acyl-phospholipid synthase-like methyltransferase